MRVITSIEEIEHKESNETKEEHLELYNEIDVALDPMPYGGATTSCEALSMGVPVITYAGEGMVGRLTASVLHSANFESCIAEKLDDYINKSVEFYKKGVRKRKERELLKEIVAKSPSGSKRVSKALEQIYINEIQSVENKCSS